MERRPVASSVIRAVGYDPKTKVLAVEFHTGRLYEYARVPAKIAAVLPAAPSIGSYFNRYIRTRYSAVEVTPDPDERPGWRTPRKKR